MCFISQKVGWPQGRRGRTRRPCRGQWRSQGYGARGEARPDSDLDLLLLARGCLTRERETQLRSRARALLLPVLPVDLDLLISDAPTAQQWSGSRWHVLGHVHREGIRLDAA